jgi:hypothetical protein
LAAIPSSLEAWSSSFVISAPGHEGNLKSVTINYKILGDKPSAKVEVWGYG